MPCRSLFGNIDPTNLLNTYYNNGLITSGSSYPVAQAGGGNRTERFTSADTGAVTSYAAGSYPNANGVRVSANPITVNSNGFYYTGRLSNNRPVGSVRGGGFEGLNMSQVRGAVIIHELLHAANRIPSDNPATLNDGGRQSRANSERVRVFCFSRLNNPNAPIPVPNNVVPNTTITLRRTERVIGRVAPTVRVGGIGPLSWLEWLYGGNQRGRGELTYAGPFR